MTHLKTFLFLILSATTGLCANHFVLPSSTGSATGADWNNAWSMAGINWSSVSPGDVLYLSGGTYTNALYIGANNITIERVLATDAAASSAAGWNAAYDSQVIITNQHTSDNTFVGIVWNDNGFNNVTIDGRTPDGISLGVSEQTTPNGSSSSGICLWFRYPANNIILTNMEFVGPSTPVNPPLDASAGIFINPFFTVSNLVVSHCEFHRLVSAIQNDATLLNSTFEHLYIHDDVIGNNGWWDGSFNPQHDNVFYCQGPATNIVFRDNIVSNWATEGIYLSGQPNGAWFIYNNIWIGNTNSTSRCFEANNSYTNGPILFANNTVVNTWWVMRNDYGAETFIGGATNNLLFNAGYGISMPSGYTLTTTDPSNFVHFMDNLHLAPGSAAIGSGLNGVDIGAYPYIAGPASGGGASVFGVFF